MKVFIPRYDSYCCVEMTKPYKSTGKSVGKYNIYIAEDLYWHSVEKKLKKNDGSPKLYVESDNVLYEIASEKQLEQLLQVTEDMVIEYVAAKSEVNWNMTIEARKKQIAENERNIRMRKTRAKRRELVKVLTAKKAIKKGIAEDTKITGDDIQVCVDGGLIKIPLQLRKALNNLCSIEVEDGKMGSVSMWGRASYKSYEKIYNLVCEQI